MSKCIDIWEVDLKRDKGSRTALHNCCDSQAAYYADEELEGWQCFCGKEHHNFFYTRTPLLFKPNDKITISYYGMKYDANIYGLMPLGWNPPDKIDYMTVLGSVVEKLGYEEIG